MELLARFTSCIIFWRMYIKHADGSSSGLALSHIIFLSHIQYLHYPYHLINNGISRIVWIKEIYTVNQCSQPDCIPSLFVSLIFSFFSSASPSPFPIIF